MIELLAFGSLFFWLLLLGWFILLWVLLESEHEIFGAIATVVYLAILQFFSGVDILHWILSNPVSVVILFGCYFVAGTVWSFWRWYLFVHEKLDLFTVMKEDWLFIKGVNAKVVPDGLKEEWIKYVEDDYQRKNICRPPKVRDYKSKIMGWIGYWPVSLISWLLWDMVRNFVKMIYNAIADWLQSISNKVFAKIRADLPDDFR